MNEALSNWRTYVPSDSYITQRGGTFLIDTDGSVLYSHRDQGIIGFSATMSRHLSFIDPFLQSEAATSPDSPTDPALKT